MEHIVETENQITSQGERSKELDKLYKSWWWIEVKYGWEVKEFEPYKTIDYTNKVLENFFSLHELIRSEYFRRFVCYLKNFLPQLENKVLYKKLCETECFGHDIHVILWTYAKAQNLEDVIEDLHKNTCFIYIYDRSYNYRKSLNVRTYSQSIPCLLYTSPSPRD
jgi:hypothetical protein